MADDNQPHDPVPTTPGESLSLLKRPFKPEVIKQRKIGGGKTVRYVPVDAVIDRLNRACAIWNFRVISWTWETMKLYRKNEQTQKTEVRDVFVYVVVGELDIPGLGARQAQGVQAIDDGAGEDLLKGAATDALKKCATLFAVPVDGM